MIYQCELYMKISIIIPTRERAMYLRQCLKTIVEIENPDIEIIISNNASEGETEKVVEEFSDKRIKYFRTPKRVSMRENFEFSVKKSTGDYVIMIGDDDGMLPQQFNYLVDILNDFRPDCISWSFPTYTWPNSNEIRTQKKTSIRKRMLFGEVKVNDSDILRQQLLDCTLETFDAVPKIYHGCSSRDYIDRISSNSGVVFNGSVPDIYFSYRAIIEGGRFVHVNHPFSISGNSPASTGNSMSMSSTDTRENNPAIMFNNENKQDNIQNVIESKLSIPLVLFSTLETVLSLYTNQDNAPEYQNWYNYIIHGNKMGNQDVRKKTLSILNEHAQKTGSIKAFESAKVSPRRRKGFFEKINRELSNFHSLSLATTYDNVDNVWSAARSLDSIIGSEYSEVLLGKSNTRQAWKHVKTKNMRNTN